MTIKITPNDKGNPPGKLADAELYFGDSDGVLAGLKMLTLSDNRLAGDTLTAAFTTALYADKNVGTAIYAGHFSGRLRWLKMNILQAQLLDQLFGRRLITPAANKQQREFDTLLR